MIEGNAWFIGLITASSINVVLIALLIVKKKLNWAIALAFLQAIIWAIQLLT